jgi:sulfur carrier protein ThiS adenylyltransferase
MSFINHFLSEEQIKKIRFVKIGIAGAGGLGSNCAFNLTRTGFSNFVIVDFDNVEESNLNRQFYFHDQIGKKKVEALKENLERINSEINIKIFSEKIEKENVLDFFFDCDIVVEAFDKAEYKSIIVNSLLNSNVKLIVSASGLAGIGRSDEIMVHKLKEKLIVIGDLKSDVKDDKPFSPKVNVAAAKQADVIVEYVLNGGLL